MGFFEDLKEILKNLMSRQNLFLIDRKAAAPKRTEQGSAIISDACSTYYGPKISKLGYNHKVIIHENNFDLHESLVHTQIIENSWLHLKHFLREKRN